MPDEAWVRMSDQGIVMGDRHGGRQTEREMMSLAMVRVRQGEGRGVTLGRRPDKERNCSPLSPSRFTLQHQNPSSHWSAHCSLHHDKRTLELPPSSVSCLLSFGSSSLLVSYGRLRATASLSWPTATEASVVRSYEKMQLRSATGGQVVLCIDKFLPPSI